MKPIVLGLGLALVVGLLVLGVVVEREGPYVFEALGPGAGAGRALVLYHPSRDAHFSDDLSLALAQGLMQAGLAVDRATLTANTPAHPAGYAIVGVVSNTYYWTPDLPTLRYLRRAQFDSTLVVGLIGGAGATGRSRQLLDRALRASGGTVLTTRAFWLWRPNDETRMGEPNRVVALDLARKLGREAAEHLQPDLTQSP